MKISFALALLIDEAVIIMTPDLVEWAEIKLVAKDQKEGMPNVIECFGLLRPGREARGQDHHQHPDMHLISLEAVSNHHCGSSHNPRPKEYWIDELG